MKKTKTEESEKICILEEEIEVLRASLLMYGVMAFLLLLFSGLLFFDIIH